MQYRNLPNTDLKVSRLAMGTMTFGSQADYSESEKMIQCCLEAGINFFDTANVYNQGASEEIVGRCLSGRRADVVLASKGRGAMGNPTEYVGLSRAALRKALEESLRRLRTDYLDIYYLHQPDYDTPIEETLETMEELRLEGKCRYAATSNYSAWQLCEIFWICAKNGYQPPVISQPMYNVLARGIEQEYIPFCNKFAVSIVAYNPLAGGLLTGKQNLDSGPLPGTRFDGNKQYLSRYWHPDYFHAVDKLKQAAAQSERSMIELAFQWLFSHDAVNSVIVGASRLEHLESNLRAAESPALNAEIFQACDEAWQELRGPTPAYNR